MAITKEREKEDTSSNPHQMVKYKKDPSNEMIKV